MCAGGMSYFTCCWIAIKAIRRTGCDLPIEVWYAGNELTEEIKKELRRLNVECENFLDHGHHTKFGFKLKPFAILKSRFREVLYLDADNVCVKDPAELFDTKEYAEHGALFWPDFWTTARENPIWAIVGSEEFGMKEQESGQVLINKEKCWKEINLCRHFNDRSEIYHRLLMGDKDTFRLAWMALKTPFHMITTEVATCGYTHPRDDRFLGTTMVQHDTQGEIAFLHRNLLKWDLTKPGELTWRRIKRFQPHAVIREYELDNTIETGHSFMNIEGDIEELDFTRMLGDIEEVCLDDLAMLRASKMYGRFMVHLHLADHRYLLNTPFAVEDQTINLHGQDF